MSKDDLNNDFEKLQKEIEAIAEKEEFNGISLLNESSTINISFQWSYEVENEVLCIYFPLSIANYFADISPDGNLHVDIKVKAELAQDIVIDISHHKLEIYLSEAFEKTFSSIDVVYLED